MLPPIIIMDCKNVEVNSQTSESLERIAFGGDKNVQDFALFVAQSIEGYSKTGEAIPRALHKIRGITELAKVHLVERYIEESEALDIPIAIFSATRHIPDILSRHEGFYAVTGASSQLEKMRIFEEFNNGKIKRLALTTSGQLEFSSKNLPFLRIVRTSLEWPQFPRGVMKRIDRVARRVAERERSLRYITDIKLSHFTDKIIWNEINSKKLILESMGL